MSLTALIVGAGLGALGIAIFLLAFGLLKLLFLPLAIIFELTTARRRRKMSAKGEIMTWRGDQAPATVSIVIPAYNEAPVLANCVNSILQSEYQHFEMLIVDDGSSDNTLEIAHRLAERDNRIHVISQKNAGKGAALNTGIQRSSGDVLMFVDADGIFLPTTITQMLVCFDSPTVGAVCGDDRPANPHRVQTRLLAVLSHAGTGLVRRALAVLNCLPIVSGNIGAFPRHVIDEIGPFDASTVGEDLELTWRVHRAGYKVTFAPRALVYAESPSTVRTLWRQRVRWARGLLQTMRMHRTMIGNPRYGSFGLYLVINTITMVISPLLQLLVLVLFPFAIIGRIVRWDSSPLAIVGWLGLGIALCVVIFAIVMDRSSRDLRYLWTLLLWPVYSLAMALVMAAALWQESSGRTANWNKMLRTGIVSVPNASQAVRREEG